MKYFLLCFLLIACSTPAVKYKPRPVDTVTTAAIYHFDSTIDKLDYVGVITKDTADLTREPIVRGRDTQYWARKPLLLYYGDSAHTPVIDSATGKQKMTIMMVPIPKTDIVIDFHINIDSLSKIKR